MYGDLANSQKKNRRIIELFMYLELSTIQIASIELLNDISFKKILLGIGFGGSMESYIILYIGINQNTLGT